MTDDIEKLIAEVREIGNRGYTTDLIHGLADALEAEHQRAETEHYQKNRARNERNALAAERDALRTAIQPVLDAWNIPGIRPDVHELVKRDLRVTWPMLYTALDALSRAIDTKEKR